MGALILPRWFNQQPQQSPRLDWSNPITRGIDVAFVRLDQPALVGPGKLTKTGSPALVPAQYGLGHYFGASTGDDFTSSAWPTLPDGTEYTYLVVAQINATTTQGFLVNGDDTTRAFQFRVDAGGVLQLIGFNTAVATAQVNAPAVAAGRAYTFLARVTSTTLSLFRDGALVASAAGPGGTIKGQSAPIRIGNRLGSNLQGSIGLLLRWPRALSDAEARATTGNPWQLFAAPPRLLVSASSGTVNVTGTYAATLAVPVFAASGAAVNAGAFAASLASPTFAASGLVATPPVGSFAATLDAPSFAASGLTVNPGMFSATLEAPTFSATGTAAPHASGTFSATLAAPTMSAFGYLGATAPAAPIKPYRWRVLRRHFTPQ